MTSSENCELPETPTNDAAPNDSGELCLEEGQTVTYDTTPVLEKSFTVYVEVMTDLLEEITKEDIDEITEPFLLISTPVADIFVEPTDTDKLEVTVELFDGETKKLGDIEDEEWITLTVTNDEEEEKIVVSLNDKKKEFKDVVVPDELFEDEVTLLSGPGHVCYDDLVVF